MSVCEDPSPISILMPLELLPPMLPCVKLFTTINPNLNTISDLFLSIIYFHAGQLSGKT